MKNILILLTLILGLKVKAQKIDTCSLPIFINNSGYGWTLEIDTPKYNTPININSKEGLIKIQIDTCLGKIDFKLFDGDTLKEYGELQIYNRLIVDSNFIEDEYGDLKAIPYYHWGGYKIGTWNYWSPKAYYMQQF